MLSGLNSISWPGLFTSFTARKPPKLISPLQDFIIRLLSLENFHPQFYVLIFPSAFPIYLFQSSSFCHPHFVIRILSSAFCQPHFVIRISSSALCQPHFVIRILSSAFRHPHFAILILAPYLVIRILSLEILKESNDLGSA